MINLAHEEGRDDEGLAGHATCMLQPVGSSTPQGAEKGKKGLGKVLGAM